MASDLKPSELEVVNEIVKGLLIIRDFAFLQLDYSWGNITGENFEARAERALKRLEGQEFKSSLDSGRAVLSRLPCLQKQNPATLVDFCDAIAKMELLEEEPDVQD